MTISIRLTNDEEARLDRLAQRTGRSKSFYVKAALQEYLTDLEDAFSADQFDREFKKLDRSVQRRVLTYAPQPKSSPSYSRTQQIKPVLRPPPESALHSKPI